MESFKDHLFYSIAEKRLFWIAGYTENSNKLSEIRKMFNDCEKKFKSIIPEKHKHEKIKTSVITFSRRYKYMRYFWIDNVTEVPDIAFKIGKGWTMIKWVED